MNMQRVLNEVPLRGNQISRYFFLYSWVCFDIASNAKMSNTVACFLQLAGAIKVFWYHFQLLQLHISYFTVFFIISIDSQPTSGFLQYHLVAPHVMEHFSNV